MRASELNSKRRFTDRVRDYARYRPSYPPAAFRVLAAEAALGEGAAVADIGSGTGIFSRQLLDAGATVYAVEPNAAMRCAAELELATRAHFVSVDGSAEATNLAPGSIDLVCCAQAFHWFEPAPTRAEFLRILRPGGRCALIWNRVAAAASEFAHDYVELELEFGAEAAAIRSRQDQVIAAAPEFFAPGTCRRHAFSQVQVLDWPGLVGRFFSASYAPKEADPRHAKACAALEQLFHKHESGGKVRLTYRTELFLGTL